LTQLQFISQYTLNLYQDDTTLIKNKQKLQQTEVV